MRTILILLIVSLISGNTYSQSAATRSLYKDLVKEGKEPLDFVNRLLKQHDLIVFDDALHPAYEPFEFYNRLLTASPVAGKIRYVFLETVSITAQPAIDSFLSAPFPDSTLLISMFQNDYSGYGWTYQTYLDLLKTVWHFNRRADSSRKIRVIGVNPPVYWEALHNWNDYSIFQQSLSARDYFMYQEILRHLHGFSGAEKGIFLTNTRHAYKNIRNNRGDLYWNTNTFFHQWHPGKTYAVRIHNVTLLVKKKTAEENGRISTEGLERFDYSWVKMDNGRWDSAFAMHQNKPVMIPLQGNGFGNTVYAGNHMVDVQNGTVMYDAYDALLFLAPLEQLHFTARFNFIYTDSFKPELERRLRILHTDFNEFLKSNGAEDFNSYYKSFKYVERRPNPLTKNL